MGREETVRAGVVAGDRAGERIDGILRDEANVTVRPVADVEAAVGAVREGDVDCLVVDGPDRYEAVREAGATIPVVVVAGDLDRDGYERVVEDVDADYACSDGPMETTLPVLVERLGGDERSGLAWRIADFSDDAVVEFDLETTALIDANETFFDAWGWDEDRLTDASVADLRETDITFELRGQGRGADGEEELEWITDEDPVESLVDGVVGNHYETREWHCHDADGRGFKSEVRVVADERVGRGYLVATTPPEEDRSRGLDHDEASMLHSLMEHVPMSVYFKDAQSRHVLVSEDVVEPFIESPEGKYLHTPEDVLTKTDFDLYPAEGAAESVREDERVMATGEPIVDSLESVEPPHGRPLYFQTTKAPWYDPDGSVRGTVGITVDVTDQKRRENELNRQNERLEEFASIVSHDLRNPLNVAEGRLELYRDTGDEAELDQVAAMLDRMERLIDDVLTFARDGSRVEEVEWFDGEGVAREAWSGVDTADAALEQEWAYRIGADRARLVRVFENLFRNAVEHAGEDVTVRVGTLADDSGFYVADDGPGIPADERDEVFERGVTENPDGTGYGLAIVREIAEAHGWDVRATESEAGGARFEFLGVHRGDPSD